ncbi:MAG: hypothetical protein ABI233_05685 [Chthoniobacterales bacterium]
MKYRPSLSSVLLACLAGSALLLSGCSTVSSRISDDHAGFEQLPPTDQALVQQGKIRGGMSQQGVYFAWGRPQQKAVGEIHGVPTETWVYLIARTLPDYGFYGGGFYGGFDGPVGYYGRRGGRRFYGAIYDPFYDPFYYPFPQTISQPVKTVSFQRGKVIAFQYLAPSS